MATKNIFDHFNDLSEPRSDNCRHNLIDIITIAISASICGADKWDDIEVFGKAKESWLRNFLELPHGIPSHDTFARVFAMLDPQKLEQCFASWIQALDPVKKDELINIDGKTVRRSHGKSCSAIHMVSAWANAAGLVLGQRKIHDKSNEITAIPELLDALQIEGCIVTIDAMGTQKRIADKIVEKQGDYILALKGNQGTLAEDVTLFFEGAEKLQSPTETIDYYRSFDKDHGRLEIREYWVSDDIEWLSQRQEWKGIRSLCMMRTQREIDGKRSSEKLYYISSCKADAPRLASAIRGHWGIENSLHWVLDIAFREDECRKRKENSAQNFSLMRRITLNLLKQETACKRSIAGKRLLAGWDTGYLEKVLFKV